VTGPVMIAARAAARRLEREGNSGLRAEVEAVLAARQTGFTPPRYADPVALAGLIVSIASLAWTVYTDLRKQAPHPAADEVAGKVRNTMDDSGQQAPDHIVDVVVAEVIRAVDDSGSP
jgi:hypothetical protein